MSFLSRSDERGFTLLEILLAMALLALISLGVSNLMANSFQLRDKLQTQGEFYNTIRLAMSILEQDLALTYSPKIMVPPADTSTPPAPPGSQDLDAILTSDSRDNTEFWLTPLDRTGVRPSRFLGKKSSLSFVSASHIRVYKEALESDFAKISYELREDELAIEGLEDTQVLVRTVNTNVFDTTRDDGDYIKSYPLLHGVSAISFRYYYREKDKWFDEWDNNKGDEVKGRFPDIVEVTLKVRGRKDLEFEGIYEFRPEIPIHGLVPST